MTKPGKAQSAQAMRPRRWHAAAALLLFVGGFAIANRFQLTHSVLYRLAAGDQASAAMAFLFLSAQATVLLAATWLLPPRWFVTTMSLAGPSILVNLAFGQIVGTTFDAATLAWMIAEARQATAAAQTFTAPLLLAGAQAAVAIALLVGARALARGSGLLPRTRRLLPALLILLILPSLIYRLATVWPESAERNLYGFAWDIATAGPPPARQQPALRPGSSERPRHILWLIDESVASAPFERIIAPQIAAIPHLDFGPAAALGHCSAPAHVALRAGVDVRRVGPTTDLRRTPSIWAYAKQANYRTLLIDGQAAGPPQNLLLPPERALIDDMWSMPGGVDTDLRIADRLNAIMKGDTPTFGYAVLRGTHFQYRDHYPPGTLAADAPMSQQYDTALAWSKTGFFARLLDGVDRRKVAIVYTADHGQNLTPGALPHCSRSPVPDEFRIPLLAFLPEPLAGRYAEVPRAGHSASQIFPATLGWMGYDPASVDARYDHDLTQPTARYVWFGRAVIPFAAGDTIAVTSGPEFPGTR